jgi:hypothetical protein
MIFCFLLISVGAGSAMVAASTSALVPAATISSESSAGASPSPT